MPAHPDGRFVLDPADCEADTEGVAGPAPVPPRVRRFGRVPDAGALRSGDLILFAGCRPTVVGGLITAAQVRSGHAPRDAGWTHAAIYLQRGQICEAVRGGVRCTSLLEYVPTHRIRARRDPTLTAEEPFLIALEAMTRLNERYSTGQLGRIAKRLLAGLWRPEPAEVEHPTICSQVYADSFAATTERFVIPGRTRDITPADLSATPTLVDVRLGWLRIV